jgi:hypothetical protein
MAVGFMSQGYQMMTGRTSDILGVTRDIVRSLAGTNDDIEIE